MNGIRRKNRSGMAGVILCATFAISAPALADGQAALLPSNAPVAATAPSANQAQSLRIGDPAPDFSLPDETGRLRRLSECRGRTVVLMFYPKAFTPGCTSQVRAVRTELPRFENRDVTVFGVSVDDVATQKAFSRSEKLNFSLLADPGKATARSYGVLGTNQLARRVTFIIGPDGLLRGIDGAVDAQFRRKEGELVSDHGANLRLLVSDWHGTLGSAVPNFFLQDEKGQTVSALPPGSKAALIVFVDPTGNPSRSVASRLRILAENPAYWDASFLAIDGNSNASAEVDSRFRTENRLPFPIARDRFSEVTNRFGASVGPTVWVLEAGGRVVYQGAFDNGKEGKESIAYAKEALDAILSGRPVIISQTDPVGTPFRHSATKSTFGSNHTRQNSR